MQALDLSKIGCSDLGALLGVDPYRSEHDLWMRLVHGTERTAPSWLDDAAALGRFHEQGTALAVLERRLGYDRKQLPSLEQPPSRVLNSRLRYSLDFVTGAFFLGDRWAPTTERPRVLECKSRRWRTVRTWGPDGSSGVAPSILAQVQGQLASIWRDRDWWTGTQIPDVDTLDVCVAVDGAEPRHYPIKRDLDLGLGMLDEAEAWFARYVDTRELPPVNERAGGALGALYPEVKAELRDPSESERALFARWSALRDEEKQLVARIDRVEAELKQAIGDGAGLFMEPGRILRWSQKKGSTQPSKVIEALVRDHGISAQLVEDLKQQTRGAPSRSLKETSK